MLCRNIISRTQQHKPRAPRGRTPERTPALWIHIMNINVMIHTTTTNNNHNDNNIIITIINNHSTNKETGINPDTTLLNKKSRILAYLFRPSRSTYSQDVCEQLRPTCSTNLPCHDMYKCSCPSRQSNFKTLFGHCFSLGRRGNHVRVRACNVRSECKKYDCR